MHADAVHNATQVEGTAWNQSMSQLPRKIRKVDPLSTLVCTRSNRKERWCSKVDGVLVRNASVACMQTPIPFRKEWMQGPCNVLFGKESTVAVHARSMDGRWPEPSHARCTSSPRGS
eukprot:scaffold840_cov344-Pavlova_lutheri.AAC.95